MSGERVQEGSGRQVGLTFPEAIGALPQNWKNAAKASGHGPLG